MRSLMTQLPASVRCGFFRDTAKMMKCSQVGFDEVLRLVPNMTSVYDLRVIFVVGAAHLKKSDIRLLLLKSFEPIMAKKFVLNDDASLVFDVVLEQCKNEEYRCDMDVRRWGRKQCLNSWRRKQLNLSCKKALMQC